MKRLFKFTVLLAVVLLCRSASAHFLWLQTEPVGKPTKVNLLFSETCAPGEAKVLDKVAQTKAWVTLPGGSEQPLTLEKQINGDTGCWASPVTLTAPASVVAACDYGVITRGGETFLLQYAARNLVVAKAEELSQAISAQPLTLEVRPSWRDQALSLAVVFQGKPAADAELLVIGPDNEERDVKLDAAGVAKIESPAVGDYAIRARVKQQISGEREGKKYEQARYYSTLTFRLPQTVGANMALAAAASSAPNAAEVKHNGPDAAELLNRARLNRAVWEKFPGFTAKVTVRIDDMVEHGMVSVDEKGTTSSEIKDEKLRDWVDEQLGSLVDHRLPSKLEDEKPSLADDDADHPFGRLIRLGDAKYESSYRIRDDMVTEVNRRAGPQKFTISVFETERNKEGKYLPKTFSATFWDAKSGEIKTSSFYLNTWKRVGNFDLPDRFLEVESDPGERHVKEMTFSDYSLNEKSK